MCSENLVARQALQIGLLVLVVGVLSSCSESTTPNDTFTIPAYYDTTSWRANAQDELLYLDQIGDLLTYLKSARTQGVKLIPVEVGLKTLALYRLFTPDGINLIEQRTQKTVAASGSTMDPMKDPAYNGTGGVFVKYLFDQHGTDVTEQVEKMLFSVALHRAAMSALDTATPTTRNVDRALALFGATPAFANSDKAIKNADRYCAAYAARRDKNDGTGFYTNIREAFKKARAAAVDAKYDKEYREAVLAIRTNWERSQMATAINYCYATSTALSATNVSDDARASGMHSFGEALGFLLGAKATDVAYRSITDVQLGEILTLARTYTFKSPTYYEFWQMPATTLGDLNTITEQLQAIYGFTESEMQDFNQNWVTVQTRQ
ncbi:MAG: DUF4856 domain-containing protein [bacterium]|nr:DUF4856 domain-containing protein [bacterium]